jgi:hypothetical protein
MPMTVPYSDFLSSAETAGGQRRMRAKKRKKAKEREERRREDCVLDGRDMFRGRKDELKRDATLDRILKGHVV